MVGGKKMKTQNKGAVSVQCAYGICTLNTDLHSGRNRERHTEID